VPPVQIGLGAFQPRLAYLWGLVALDAPQRAGRRLAGWPEVMGVGGAFLQLNLISYLDALRHWRA
jgi:hypothetical protein